MKIVLSSVFVEDQNRARMFYTDVLGFVKKKDFPVGEFNWLTVGNSDGSDGVELLLEPNDNQAAKTFQQAIYEQGIAATSFAVDDIQSEFKRLTNLGVKFTMEPTQQGPVTIAVFDDTCGNLIQIAQA